MRRWAVGLVMAPAMIASLSRADDTDAPVDVTTFGADPTGGNESASAFQAAFDAMAGVGAVTAGEGTYVLGSRVDWPSGTHFAGTSSTFINGTGTAGGIWSTVFAARPDVTSNSGVVSVPVIVNSQTVTVAMGQAPTAGHALLIGHGTAQAVYDIVSVSGDASQLTIAVERPIVWPWLPGDLVTEVSAYPHDILVSGNGLQLSGPSLQLVEAAQARNLVISGITCGDVSQVTGSPFGLDCACRESVLEDISCAHTDKSAAIYLQSNESSIVRRLQASGGGGAANLYDCYNSVVQDSWSYDSTIGNDFQVTAINPGETFGSSNSWVTGGGVVNSAGSAYAVSYSTGTLVDNVTVTGGVNGADIVHSSNTVIRDMTVHGVDNDGVSVDGLSSGTTIEGLALEGAEHAIEIGAGATGTRVSESSSSGTSVSAITSSADLVVHGFQAECSTSGGLPCVLSTAGRFLFERGTLASASSNATLVQVNGGTADIRKLNGQLTTGINQTALYLTGGTTYLEDDVATGPGRSYGIYAKGPDTTVVIGPGCDFSGTAVPITVVNGAAVSMQQTGGTANVQVSGGNTTLAFQDNYRTTLRVTGDLSSNATIAPLPIPGLEFTVVNHTTGQFSLGIQLHSTINVASGKRARIGVSTAGDVVRLSPDI